MYTLFDTKTKTTSGTYKTFSTAARARDRKDLVYGACRYAVKRKEGRNHDGSNQKR